MKHTHHFICRTPWKVENNPSTIILQKHPKIGVVRTIELNCCHSFDSRTKKWKRKFLSIVSFINLKSDKKHCRILNLSSSEFSSLVVGATASFQEEIQKLFGKKSKKNQEEIHSLASGVVSQLMPLFSMQPQN